MPVDSRGSTKPLDRPMATQFFTHELRLRPIRILMWLACSAVGGRSEVARNSASASSLESERAGVDVARAGPAVERDVPDPAGVHGRGGRVGVDAVRLDVAGDLQRDRAVAEQRVGEGDERLPERLVDQQAAEAGAVDEEVAVDRAMPLGDDDDRCRRPRAA